MELPTGLPTEHLYIAVAVKNLLRILLARSIPTYSVPTDLQTEGLIDKA